MKRIMTIIALLIIVIVFMTFKHVDKPNSRKRPLVLKGEKMSFIEREFNRQIPRQLNDDIVVLLLPSECAGEKEDEYIENKGKEVSLYLTDVIFNNLQVMYKFRVVNSNE